jgi:ribonuclease P protein component
MNTKRQGAGNIEKNIPAEQKEATQQTRLHASDVNEIGKGHTQEEKGEGSKKTRTRLSATASSNSTARSSTHPMPPNRVFHRLHRRKDILRVIKKGKRVRGSSFDLVILKGEEGLLRIAVVVPLHGMRAVDRNRVRRRAKEAIDRGGFLERINGDVVVRAKRTAYERSYKDISEELKQTFDTLRQKGGG